MVHDNPQTFPDIHWSLGFYLKSLVSTDVHTHIYIVGLYKYPLQATHTVFCCDNKLKHTRQKQLQRNHVFLSTCQKKVTQRHILRFFLSQIQFIFSSGRVEHNSVFSINKYFCNFYVLPRPGTNIFKGFLSTMSHSFAFCCVIYSGRLVGSSLRR